ncbi:MAG TPA: hypothetical protein VFB35_06090 [Gaiellaceae bacterium]|nr:hypothetical protein [Gaiellaceae bacterium]
MHTKQRKRWVAIGAAFGAGVAAVVAAALGAFASPGIAASAAKPVNQQPPIISGTPQEDKTLNASRGDWTNNPTDYDFQWVRCDKNGGSCANIVGATSRSYKLTSVDVGNTIRFKVKATNASGSTVVTSVPTAVISKAAAPTPSRPTGCPATGNPDQVSQMSLPAKLIVDQFQSQPSSLDAGTNSFVLRVHVISTCGGPVQGAEVYGTPTPFNQFGATQSTTGSDGWATLSFSRQANYPVNGKQQILAMFLRAAKPGENVLAGITGYRLVSVDVNLHG